MRRARNPAGGGTLPTDRGGLRAGAALALVLALSAPAPARVWHVTPEGTGDVPTIQEAIEVAATGDEIVLADGVFRGEGNRDVDFLGKAVTVRSASGDPSSCVIDCEGVPGSLEVRGGFRFASGEGPDSAVEGVTVTNGWLDVGGAVTCHASSPTIRDCVFRGNAAWQGGAVSLRWSSTLIEDCLIVENAATQSRGGGVNLHASQAVLRRCTISFNEAGADPGGNVRGGNIAITGTVSSPSSVLVENCIVSHAVAGEGVYCDISSRTSLVCTDVFGNAGGDWIDGIADQAGRNGNFALDPLFCGSPAQDDFALSGGSPCLPGNHPDGAACGLIGARGGGCGPVSTESTSWGRTKGLYR